MKIFLTDGTADGFFTAVFDAYREKECKITSCTEIQLGLDSEIITVKKDVQKCARVVRGLCRRDGSAADDIKTVLRNCDKNREQIAFEYIKKLLETGRPIDKNYNLEEVAQFVRLKEKVGWEVHKLGGLLRFMEGENGEFYAPYSPDNDITDLLMPHFASRFSAEKFIIHDVGRGVAGIYNGARWIMILAEKAEICLSGREQNFQTLWKRYYAAVNIKERPHEKQMKGYMPVRYWKFLPEKSGV